MSEHHILVSTYVGSQLHAHAYLACRNVSEPDARENERRLTNLMAGVIEKHVTGWIALLMGTPLKTGRQVQAALTKRGEPEICEKLKKFKAKEVNIFYCVWFSNADDPLSQKLMDLH